MIERLKRHSRLLIVALVGHSMISACGPKNPYSDALSISVDPSKNVLIGVGPEPTCQDKSAYKQSLLSGSATTLTRSAGGPVITFQSFELDWNSPDTLYIQGMRVTVTGAGIAGTYEFDLSATELESLLATPQAIINPSALETGTTTTPAAKTIIVSNDNAARTSTIYAPCSLEVSGVPLTSGNKTSPFTATVIITVLGTAEDASKNQRFVLTTFTATARYYGS